MRVTAIDLFRISMPLVHEFETSSHRKSEIEHILVRMEDASGEVGWGEIASPSGPFFCAETVETAEIIARDHLAPRVLSLEWNHPSDVAACWAPIRGNEFAKAGMDAAAWDLWSRAHGLSLSAALGGVRTRVAAGVSLGIEADIDRLLTEAAHHVSAGYTRLKLKIKPGWDSEPIQAVRDAFPHVLLHVDANGGYRADEAHFAALGALDQYGLAMIEQPFAPRQFAAHAALREQIHTPICLDESITGTDDLDTMLALKAATILNIKVSRVGGLTAALEVYRRARSEGVDVWCGGMHEFGVGRAANVALASLPGFDYPSDVSGSDKYYAQDIIDPPIVAENGFVVVPDGPGIGHRVDVAQAMRISVSV